MASPQSNMSDAAPDANHEQISFRFCSECSNMLYPKEDTDAHKLQFTCRTCQYTEDATSTCVFRNVLNTSAGETAGVTQDVGTDPTVSTTGLTTSIPGTCTLCGIVIYCAVCGDSMSRTCPVRRRKEERQQQTTDTIYDYASWMGMSDWSADDYDEETAASETSESSRQ